RVTVGDLVCQAAILELSVRDSIAQHVHKKIFDKVVAGVADEAKKIKLGPGLDPSTQMGPLVSNEQFKRVTGFINSGVQDGAEVVTGGKKGSEDGGYFVQPTVITKTKPDMKVVREEIFGPVVCASPITDHCFRA